MLLPVISNPHTAPQLEAARTRRPTPGEHAPGFNAYMQRVPDGDILQTLHRQHDTTLALLSALGDASASWRPAPGEWSVKQVVGNLIDVERIFAFRALWLTRSTDSTLPGFDEDGWVESASTDASDWHALLTELRYCRAASVRLFAQFDADAWDRAGVVGGSRSTARGWVWALAGHELQHVKSLQTTYRAAWDGVNLTPVMANAAHFGQVAADHVHVLKVASPAAPLLTPTASFKWHLVNPAADTFSLADVQQAQQRIARDLADGRLTLQQEVGYVVQHRTASRDILYVCSWRGNNETWETLYSRDRERNGAYEMAQRPSHTATFCVWVIPLVMHEQGAWLTYLRSKRDAHSQSAYFEHMFSGVVG